MTTDTEKEKARKELLQNELEHAYRDLDDRTAIGEDGFVFGHLDLLSGNVIVLPQENETAKGDNAILPITFIDYEYATPSPAAFDIANHFAEWAGFDLDYSRLPTRSVRREFLIEYVSAYNNFASTKLGPDAVDMLEADVDRWRGMPGMFWGIWSLIQAQISHIDFDYANYAELRLAEFGAAQAEQNGVREQQGKIMPLREQRWAQEV